MSKEDSEEIMDRINQYKESYNKLIEKELRDLNLTRDRIGVIRADFYYLHEKIKEIEQLMVEIWKTCLGEREYVYDNLTLEISDRGIRFTGDHGDSITYSFNDLMYNNKVFILKEEYNLVNIVDCISQDNNFVKNFNNIKKVWSSTDFDLTNLKEEVSRRSSVVFENNFGVDDIARINLNCGEGNSFGLYKSEDPTNKLSEIKIINKYDGNIDKLVENYEVFQDVLDNTEENIDKIDQSLDQIRDEIKKNFGGMLTLNRI